MTAARRLAAILAVDVVGYSRLMGEDEAGTALGVREHRDAARPIVAGLGGRIVKTTGDGLLLEFPSVVDAVECAIAIQKLMAERNADTPEAKRIVYRIGVNLGDVLIEGDDILGEGVNIAARLEGLCEPGGVLISGAAYDHVRGRIDADFVDLGDKYLKNIARPVRIYSLASSAPAPMPEPPKPPIDQPSLAVLPFACFSEERELKYLTEAMTEDLITILARIPGFIVIARQSSFVYQGGAIDSRRIGRELGVRYIVDGSLRPVGPQLRVGAQLIDAATGAQLWADRFDRQPENVLELQDQIARAIAGRIEPELVRAEIALIRRRRDASPSAWSCYREGAGMISLKGWSEETLTRATALLRQAASLDPDFALARAQLALLLSLGARHGLMAEGAAAVTEARAEAERAVEIDPDASEVLGYAGCALAELGEVQRGSEILERAIENDPSNAQAWVALGTAQCFLEKMGDVGLEKLRQGMRLSPRDHRLGFWGTYYALALARHRRLEEAYEEARVACRRDPQFYVARIVLALTAAGLDRKGDAIAALREAKRLRPRLSLEEIQLLVGRRATLLAPLWDEVSKSPQ
ncbi:MAG: adenylate/guanylate cyclase domain-containing protein [Roseiarcus sp.]|uniref:adenylate/guanylate cyclase domain-containing protein n=1 Tax=Roseiarcus sp. TaxID=1969460 RepID=UPI003BB193FA